MGTLSITLPIIIIEPQKIAINDDPSSLNFPFITHYSEDKVSITQFLAAFCPHFHYPLLITAEE